MNDCVFHFTPLLTLRMFNSNYAALNEYTSFYTTFRCNALILRVSRKFSDFHSYFFCSMKLLEHTRIHLNYLLCIFENICSIMSLCFCYCLKLETGTQNELNKLNVAERCF